MKNKDILLKDNKNNNLYPLAHKDSEQNVINDFYYGARVWLASNTNLNDIIKPGAYWLASGRNFTNAPWSSGSSKYGLLEVSKAEGDTGTGGGARRIIQKITRTVVSNSNITEITFWYRYYGTNGWSNWLEYSGTDSTNSFGLIKISGSTISASIPGDSFSISGGAGVLLSTNNNTITIGVDTGTLGGGTVTYVAVANTGGLSITGSTITSSGTISIGLTQLISSPPSSVAIYPIKFSKYGRITAFDSAITIPTKLTDLTNDGNFVQDSSYVHTNNNFTTTLKNKLDGIESSAQVNAIESIYVNNSLQSITNKSVNITIPQASSVYNGSLTFKKDDTFIKAFTANASANKTITFTTDTVNTVSLLTKSFIDSITFTSGTLPTTSTQKVITGGTSAQLTIPSITAKTVVDSVTFNNVVTGGTSTSFKPVSKKTVVTGGSTTAFSQAAKKTVITSASGATASYSSGILVITNGSFTSGDSISFDSAINVYTSLTTGDSVEELSTISVYTLLSLGAAGTCTTSDSVSISTESATVYTSLTSKNIDYVSSVGTLPSLSWTSADISNAVSITSTTVLTNVS